MASTNKSPSEELLRQRSLPAARLYEGTPDSANALRGSLYLPIIAKTTYIRESLCRSHRLSWRRKAVFVLLFLDHRPPSKQSTLTINFCFYCLTKFSTTCSLSVGKVYDLYTQGGQNLFVSFKSFSSFIVAPYK